MKYFQVKSLKNHFLTYFVAQKPHFYQFLQIVNNGKNYQLNKPDNKFKED